RSGAALNESRALLIGRLLKLERMGLARAIGPARWLLAEEAEPSLRELGIRGDIIRTMQRALSAQGQDRSPTDLAIFDVAIASVRHRAELAHAYAANSEALVEAHVRRLEALRRGGRHVERLPDGRWRVPEDYLDRARAYDVKHAAVPDIELRTLSTLPLERQV